jgi:thiaminase/transcriptional activator TenA
VLVDEVLRRPAAAWFEAATTHPFVRGIGDGTLSRERFRYFIAQDYWYLDRFLRVLALGAVRADRPDRTLFLTHAETVATVEQDLHARLAPSLGLPAAVLAETAPGPVTVAYTDHLLRVAWEEPLAVLVAAVLPCYWVYRDVGLALMPTAPAEDPYASWIATYAGAPYGQAVDEMLGLADRVLGAADDGTRRRAAQAFWRSARYEWLFWEQAWHLGHFRHLATLPEEPSFA